MESKESEQQKQSFEFEPARFFESFVAVGKALLTRPRFFFQQIPQSAAIMNPGIFLVVCAFLAALLMANVRQGDANLFALLLFSNIFSGYVGSWILHLLIVRIFRSQAPFGATFRIIAYSSIMDIGSGIPLAGPIAYIYGLYLLFIGLQEVHRLKPGQAVAAVLSIVFIIMLLLIMMVSMSPESLNEGMRLLNPEQGGM